MTNIKTLFLGSVVTLLGVIAGEGLAHADCDLDTSRSFQAYQEAVEDMAFCHTDGAVVAVDEHGFFAMCLGDKGEDLGDIFDLAEERCDHAAQGWLEDGSVSEPQLAGMFRSCMILATGGAR